MTLTPNRDQVQANKATVTRMLASSSAYSWLNHVQCVGKMVEVKGGVSSFAKYDMFIVR